MGYCDHTTAELIALTRERRAQSKATRRLALQAKWGATIIARRRGEGTFEGFLFRITNPDPRFKRSVLQGRLFRAQDGRCYLCAKPFNAFLPPTDDHVVPRKARRGLHANVLLACRPCNRRKACREPTPAELAECARIYVLMVAEERAENLAAQMAAAAAHAGEVQQDDDRGDAHDDVGDDPDRLGRIDLLEHHPDDADDPDHDQQGDDDGQREHGVGLLAHG